MEVGEGKDPDGFFCGVVTGRAVGRGQLWLPWLAYPSPHGDDNTRSLPNRQSHHCVTQGSESCP